MKTWAIICIGWEPPVGEEKKLKLEMDWMSIKQELTK